MPILNLRVSIFGRPIKPVSLVLMGTMLIVGIGAIFDIGLLGESNWADLIATLALTDAVLFMIAWIKNSQILTEWALVGAFFIWGFRFWALLLIFGWGTFHYEYYYLAFMWMLISGGSWLLERSDPNALVKDRGAPWTRH